jgi:hypothetical protein
VKLSVECRIFRLDRACLPPPGLKPGSIIIAAFTHVQPNMTEMAPNFNPGPRQVGTSRCDVRAAFSGAIPTPVALRILNFH